VPETLLEIQHLTKRFGGVAALSDVRLTVCQKEIVALIGPNGAGKTTLFNCVTAVLKPDTGTIQFGRDGKEPLVGLLPHEVVQCGIARTFQNIRLFTNMTVVDHLLVGIYTRTHTGLLGAIFNTQEARREERWAYDRAMTLLELFGLSSYTHQNASSLPFGLQRRLEIARSLASEPELLLLDEPFGALDARLRKGLRSWLKTLHDQIRLTTLLVTHDQEEAFELSDKVVVVNQGRIEQQGDPKRIFNEPSTEFVARFVGETNSVEGQVVGESVDWGPFQFALPDGVRGQSTAAVLFRPIDVYVSSQREGRSVPGFIRATKFLGAFEELSIEIENEKTLIAHVPKGLALQSEFRPGKDVFVDITSAYVFPN
jgi:ABC-type branched-subunit amino acid transport system ATPase component